MMGLWHLWQVIRGVPKHRMTRTAEQQRIRCGPRVEFLEDRIVLDTTPLTIVDPNLEVTTVLATGLSQPIGIVFLASNDFLVLEKASGQVKRVINGTIQSTPVLDLAVNSNSERGLLSMVLHPNFPATPYVYIRWTESSTGSDSSVVSEVQLLGNRVDRFIWNGSTLTLDQNIIKLRARQSDNAAVPGHPGTQNNDENGNQNGGVLKFGPDGKLYLFVGDLGRRGWMQNLPNGPFLTAPFVDDGFGGPAPDNAHLSGVILRLNEDGTVPADNPFFAAGAAMGGEVGMNIQKIFSYGHGNGFGMAFDSATGSLWETENADDAYSELNRVVPAMNGGWIQFAGPSHRVGDWKFIETTQFGSSLQQVRYPPTRAAYTAALAQSRMFMLPGAAYVNPELSWRYEIGPAGATFVAGNTLGAAYNGSLWFGSARSFQQVGANGGSLYRINLTADRLHVDVSADPRLADRVADNLFRPQKFDGTESETIRIGAGFGTTPDIEQGPDGNLYVVSITDNAIYKISRRPGAASFASETRTAAAVGFPATTQHKLLQRFPNPATGKNVSNAETPFVIIAPSGVEPIPLLSVGLAGNIEAVGAAGSSPNRLRLVTNGEPRIADREASKVLRPSKLDGKENTTIQIGTTADIGQNWIDPLNVALRGGRVISVVPPGFLID